MIFWQVLAIRYNDDLLFPKPILVFDLFYQPEFLVLVWSNLQITLSKILIVQIWVIPIGLVLGLVLGFSRPVFALSQFSLDFLRSIPTTALFPIFMLWFGINETTSVLVCSFTSALILTFAVAKEVANLPANQLFQLRSEGASWFQILIHYVFWKIIYNFLTSIRITLNLTIVVILVLEMFIGSTGGIGRQIIDAKSYFLTTQMFFWLILIGLTGYLLNLILDFVSSFFKNVA